MKNPIVIKGYQSAAGQLQTKILTPKRQGVHTGRRPNSII